MLFLTGHTGDSKAAGGVWHVAGPLLPMTYPLRPHWGFRLVMRMPRFPSLFL